MRKGWHRNNGSAVSVAVPQRDLGKTFGCKIHIVVDANMAQRYAGDKKFYCVCSSLKPDWTRKMRDVRLSERRWKKESSSMLRLHVANHFRSNSLSFRSFTFGPCICCKSMCCCCVGVFGQSASLVDGTTVVS